MSTARSAMVHRAEVQSNTEGGVDDWGNPLPASWGAATDVPCRAWAKMRKEVIDGDKTAIVEDVRAIFARDASVTEDNRIINIKDRQGTVKFTGPFDVVTIAPRKNQLEAMLERIKS